MSVRIDKNTWARDVKEVGCVNSNVFSSFSVESADGNLFSNGVERGHHSEWMPLTFLGDGNWGPSGPGFNPSVSGSPGDVVWGTRGIRGSRERAKALEEMTLHQIAWFLSDIEAFQSLSNQYRLISAYWL